MVCRTGPAANSKWLLASKSQCRLENEYLESDRNKVAGSFYDGPDIAVKEFKKAGITDFLAKERQYEDPFL